MKWYRSWPKVVPEHRSYVVDDLPRLVIENYDLATAPEILYGDIKEDFVLVEWDIAINQFDAKHFERECLREPNIVHIVPYMQNGQWTPFHRADGLYQLGFGCIYFPWSVVDKFMKETYDPVRKTTWFTDGEFSRWYDAFNKNAIRVHYDVNIVHLNNGG